VKVTYSDRFHCQVLPEHFDTVMKHIIIRINQLKDGTGNQHSNVNDDPYDRQEKSPRERACQIVGEYAINVFIRGYEEGFIKFDEFRTMMNAMPSGDDGGTDVLGYRIDVKTSARQTDLPPLEFCISLTDWEKNTKAQENDIFVLAVCEKGYIDPENRILKVDLLCFAYVEEIDRWVEKYRKFKKKWIRHGKDCKPLSELPYQTAMKSQMGIISM
jgi:hypothetical protein